MSARGAATYSYVRLAAIGALIVINIVLLGLNLQKHGIFPFEAESGDQTSLNG